MRHSIICAGFLAGGLTIGLAAPSGALSTTPEGEIHKPTTLTLTCAPTVPNVTCTWTQTTNSGFAHYVLLRSRPTGRGRVILYASDVSKTTTVDTRVAPCDTSTYLVDVLDSANNVLEHSNVSVVPCPSPPNEMRR
ncbi:MAG: hypothetical protein NVS3B21_26380 [Acidimicrobiales bacterium]